MKQPPEIIAELLKRIELLERRVAELEEQQQPKLLHEPNEPQWSQYPLVKGAR